MLYTWGGQREREREREWSNQIPTWKRSLIVFVHTIFQLVIYIHAEPQILSHTLPFFHSSSTCSHSIEKEKSYLLFTRSSNLLKLISDDVEKFTNILPNILEAWMISHFFLHSAPPPRKVFQWLFLALLTRLEKISALLVETTTIDIIVLSPFQEYIHFFSISVLKSKWFCSCLLKSGRVFWFVICKRSSFLWFFYS